VHRTVVLVEGPSDQRAVEILARRLGRDLAAEGVTITSMGGATNITRFLMQHAAADGPRLLGLYDCAEQWHFRRGLARAGYGDGLDGDALERLGFHRCVTDLEDELIRALGTDAVLQVLEAHGDLPSFRILQRQPAHRGRPEAAQLRRFLGTHSGRKLEYAGLLAEALDLARIPRPLRLLLARA
jgi:hypothetical protein